MARTSRLKKSGGTARYHLMSRTNDRRFLFTSGAVKTDLLDALKRAAAFSGIALNAYTALDNHFHVVCTVEAPSEPVPADELVRRYRILYGGKRTEALLERWKGLEAAGFSAQLDEEHDRLRRRMNDISEFMKTFKEVFDRRFKRERKYTGSIWSGRFNSTLIEGGEYFNRCKRYLQLNAVRAGIVTRAKDYLWTWCEDDGKCEGFAGSVPGSAGSVPEAALLRRVPQIGAGKVFGSARFVLDVLFALGDRLSARHVSAHAVGTLGYSSHGWRLAKAEGAPAERPPGSFK